MLGRLQPFLVLTALGLLFFGELVLHPTAVLYADHSDLLAMHLPLKRFLVRSWQETGEVPLWCPYSFAGMPLVHDVQVAAFYPLHLPLYLLPEESLGAALSWLVVVHVLIAGGCMFLYGRSRGLAPPGALVAALGYMFAGKWLLHILAGGHYIMLPLAWLPLVLLGLEQALRRRSLRCATGAGAAFALIVLGTHPQMTLYAGLFTAVWSLGTVWERRDGAGRQGPSLGRWLGFGLGTAAVAAALSAIQLLPALEAAPEASRAAGVSVRAIAAGAAPSLLGLVGPGWTEGWEDRAGLGLLWVAAAAMAPVLGRGPVRFQAGVCAGLLFFSLGGAVLLQGLPGFRLFQIPVRMLMLLALPVALLAGNTAQALFAGSAAEPAVLDRCRRTLRSVLLGGLLLSGGAAIAAYGHWRQQTADPYATTFLAWVQQLPAGCRVYGIGLLFTIPAAFWLLGERCRLPRRLWGLAGLALLLCDSWSLTWPAVAVRPEADLYALSPCVRELVRAKEANPLEPWRVLDRGLPGLPSSTPLGAALPLLGPVQLEPVLGYNSFDLHRYKAYLQLVLDEDKPIRPRDGIFGYPILEAFPIRNKLLLDLLGVRYLLQPGEAFAAVKASGEPACEPSWQRVDQDPWPHGYSFLAGGVQNLPPYVLFENRDYFPRAFVVYEAAPLAERPHVLEQLKASALRRRVLLEGPVAAAGPTSLGRDLTPASIQVYQPNRVRVEARAEAAGYLVLADPWFPGWNCTVDGQAVPLYRADFLFRAVAVPAGTHEVVFTFAPVSYRWGKILSASALLGVVGLNLLGWGRRKRSQ